MSVRPCSQGICRTLAEFYTNPTTLCRLWVHEVERVFSDRMVGAYTRPHFSAQPEPFLPHNTP